MSNEKQADAVNLNDEVRKIWDQNAQFWDGKMGDGNAFQRMLVAPASERLLALHEGENVLEIACGNGVFARRMVQLGVQVLATDFSEQFLERARARNLDHDERITYRQLDATHEEEIVALGERRFDAAVCNMALMDMSEIEPLMRGIRRVVKPAGRFVFSLLHPCFNHCGMAMCSEEATVNGELVTTNSLRIISYLHNQAQKGIGIIGQPASQYYFDRPLHVLFQACFQAGLVLDGLEEPAFESSDVPGPRARHSWYDYNEIPPVLVARWRIPA